MRRVFNPGTTWCETGDHGDTRSFDERTRNTPFTFIRHFFPKRRTRSTFCQEKGYTITQSTEEKGRGRKSDEEQGIKNAMQKVNNGRQCEEGRAGGIVKVKE